MKRVSLAAAVLCLFAVLGVTGLWHGFPLMDVFADEMYYAYGPLYALQSLWPLPHNVPYGTVTFYFTLPLQMAMLGLAWLYGLQSGEQLIDVIMRYPFLAYVAPRVLSLTLFLLMVAAALRYARSAAYGTELVLIGFSNLVLITFMHSGKMWMTCAFFLLLAVTHLERRPVRAVAYAGIAFANFPVMGIFWLQALITGLYRQRHDRWTIRALLAVGLLFPAGIMLLNAESIAGQVREIFTVYVYSQVEKAAPKSGGAGTVAWLYATTLWAYLQKILLTSAPTLGVGVLAMLARARVRDRAAFWFSITGCGLYVLAVSGMFYSADILGYLRYLIPVHILAAALFLSLEFPGTAWLTAGLRAIAAVSVYAALVASVSLALPTTYNRALTELRERYSHPQFIVLSRVSQISLPFSTYSARLTQALSPDSCSHRCQYALRRNVQTDFQGTYFFLMSEEAEKRVTEVAVASGLTIVDVRPDPADAKAVQAEYGMGSYIQREAWIPSRLGQRVLLEER